MATIVQPPPGVSSMYRRPALASMKPRLTARPRPTPGPPAAPGLREGVEQPFAVSPRDARPAIDHAEHQRPTATVVASTRTGARRRGEGRSARGSPPPVRAAPGRPAPGAADSVHSHRDLGRPCPNDASALADHLVDPTAPSWA